MHWAVVLEASPCDEEAVIDLAAVEELAGTLGDPDAVALYSPDRYAVQFGVEADKPEHALALGHERWRHAVATLGLPRWPLVRAEVLTPDELAPLESAAAGDLPVLVQLGDDVSVALLEVTRGLVRAQTVHQVMHLLVRFVHRLGARALHPGEAAGQGMPVDLSFGQLEQPLLPVADRLSLARLRLEETLPGVMEDARTVVDRLEREVAAVRA